MAESPSHGFSRVTISQRRMPNEYWSHFSLTALARNSSGGGHNSTHSYATQTSLITYDGWIS